MTARDNFQLTLSLVFMTLAAIVACLGLFMIVHGYPAPEWLPGLFGKKSIRKIIQLFFLLGALSFLLHPKRKEKIDGFFTGLTVFSQGAKGITWLIVIYSILFLWNQLTGYWSAEINFLPFSFYDYMLHYFWEGKINFTGLLHWFYHANLILYVLAPLWYLFKSSLVLVLSHGPLLALAALPLFLLTRRLFPNSWIPLGVSFLYLNFRYLLNLLEMDFLAESFYPLLIFTALYFFVAEKRKSFWLSIFLVLLVKEDAPLYMAALGAFLLKFKGKRTYGLGAIVLSVTYGIFLYKLFIPWTGSNILEGSSRNFRDAGTSPGEILFYYSIHPWLVVEKLFWPLAKLKTHLKLLQMTLFLPLLSPWYALVLVSLMLPFAQASDQYGHFTDLRFHYSAVVIPFLFIALVMGLRNLDKLLKRYRRKESLYRLLFFLLVLIAGGNYLSHSVKNFQIETIQKVKAIPRDALLVTQGHLLPYAGYRLVNFYFAWPYERENHPFHEAYQSADYYFLARSVNAYPNDPNWLEEKIEDLKRDEKLELVYDDGERVLFKRKGESYQVPEHLNPKNYRAERHEEYSE